MSAETKWTPGPWEVASEKNGDWFVQVAVQPKSAHPAFDRYRINHGWIGGDPSNSPNPEYGNAEANAHLIAAAPELYASLAELVSWMPGPLAWHFDAPIKAVERAREVLAKARGES